MITLDTRNESYDDTRELALTRRDQVFEVLLHSPKPVTANELAARMYALGITPNADRNNVHPRLNELVASGDVDVVGKRICTITQRRCAVYEVSRP